MQRAREQQIPPTRLTKAGVKSEAKSTCACTYPQKSSCLLFLLLSSRSSSSSLSSSPAPFSGSLSRDSRFLLLLLRVLLLFAAHWTKEGRGARMTAAARGRRENKKKALKERRGSKGPFLQEVLRGSLAFQDPLGKEQKARGGYSRLLSFFSGFLALLVRIPGA